MSLHVYTCLKIGTRLSVVRCLGRKKVDLGHSQTQMLFQLMQWEKQSVYNVKLAALLH